MAKASIKKNATLNLIRTALAVLFPLITYPYATRVLGVDNIGKVQFGLSVISYFSLIAALGVSTYGTRQGAFVRDDRKKFSKFASELFNINLLSTLISYILLVILLFLPTTIANYRELIFIQSLVIIFNTLSVDWIYSAQENFLYITMRTIVVQIISVILLFVLIKRPDDYYLYALISTVAAAGSGVINFIHAKKYCDIKLFYQLNLKKHLKPLLALFASAIAVQIYVNSDVVMLGLMSGDNSVGIYSIPVKIYTIVKSVLNATIVVSIPRFSYYVANAKEAELKKLSSKIINTSITLILPVITLLFLLSQNVIYFMAGRDYLDGSIALQILSFALLFAVASNFFGNAILVSHKLEKRFLIATIVGATLNILLNFAFIPIWQQNGAALATVLAEAAVAITCATYARGLYGSRKTRKNIIQSFIGCVAIITIYVSVHTLKLHPITEAILIGATGIIAYIIVLLIQKNTTVTSIAKTIITKFQK